MNVSKNELAKIAIEVFNNIDEADQFSNHIEG